MNRIQVRRRLLWAIGVACLLVLASAAPAFAYYESSQTVGPSGTPSWACPSCHGIEDGATSPTVAPRTVSATAFADSEAGTNVGTRKGPHGGYTTGTNKCELCHVVHNDPQASYLLLRAQTVVDLCYTCHDGTGGSGVYGVIQARTGKPAASEHRVETTTAPDAGMQVPGGQSDGTTRTVGFSGTGGSLTCTDCHSPHGTDCVKPFIGDRMRTSDDSTVASIATNHLLKTKPGRSGEVTVAISAYGSDWCETCHKGRHSDSTATINHAVADSSTAPGWNYSRVNKVAGYNTTTVATGSLGGDNFGYVSDPSWRKATGNQKAPICQQCHEDARNVGDTNPSEISTPATPAEGFQVTTPDSQNATDNPRFQNFPHEGENVDFLVETNDDLCMNCHTVSSLP